jgi:hypothetical protein
MVSEKMKMYLIGMAAVLALGLAVAGYAVSERVLETLTPDASIQIVKQN